LEQLQICEKKASLVWNNCIFVEKSVSQSHPASGTQTLYEQANGPVRKGEAGFLPKYLLRNYCTIEMVKIVSPSRWASLQLILI
jgi:hypothetical protein